MTEKKMPHPYDDLNETRIDPKLDAMIGKKLRDFYDDLAAEPVPGRILDLIAQLDVKERGGRSGSSQ